MIQNQGGIDLPPFFSLHAFETIDSTNLFARNLADQGEREGALVWSLKQEQGVGRRGRDWSSPSGNLYCSVLLRPDCDAAEGAKLSFLIAIALLRAVKDTLPDPDAIALKWPNDLLINRKKLAGILLESKSDTNGKLDWLVVGTGVNIATFPQVTEGLAATSLNNEGSHATVQQVLENYSYQLLELYMLWKTEGFDPIRRIWMDHAIGLGEKITVRLPAEEFTGIFQDLDPGGALVLALENGETRLVTAGEVFFSAN